MPLPPTLLPGVGVGLPLSLSPPLKTMPIHTRDTHKQQHTNTQTHTPLKHERNHTHTPDASLSDSNLASPSSLASTTPPLLATSPNFTPSRRPAESTSLVGLLDNDKFELSSFSDALISDSPTSHSSSVSTHSSSVASSVVPEDSTSPLPSTTTLTTTLTNPLAEIEAVLAPTHNNHTPSPPPPVPFQFARRFQLERVLSRTIFGELRLCRDLITNRRVVVKVSEQNRMTQRHVGGEVHEDVRKEATVMRTLGLDRLPESIELTNRHIDRQTCGLSPDFFRRHASPHDPTQLSSSALSALSLGRHSLTSLIGEFETSSSHYLATEYAEGGDLYHVLTESSKSSNPDDKVTNERQARKWMTQLCQAVLYLHAQSIAHLDLSVENVCLDHQRNIKLIDHGLAARHPHARCETFVSSSNSNVDGVDGGDRILNTLSLIDDRRFKSKKNCTCHACWSSIQQLQTRTEHQIAMTIKRFPGYVAAVVKEETQANGQTSQSSSDEAPMEVDSVASNTVVGYADASPSTSSPIASPIASPSSSSSSSSLSISSRLLSQRCNFLLRPVCQHSCKPGKLSYISPELIDTYEQQQPFDAFKNDSFSLGVILFILITGIPPFVKANERNDTWFRWFMTGEWMESRRYTQPVARHYTQLSPNAMDLIDSIFKPQHVRPTVDQILEHPWFDEAHPLSQPIDRLNNMRT